MTEFLRFKQKKICEANRYTRTISLPTVWLDNVGLKANDLVDLVMTEDGSLVITPATRQQKKK